MNESFNSLKRQRDALLKKIRAIGPLMMGTPTYLRVRCGNPDCKCAKRYEDRHEKLHVSWTEAGKAKGTIKNGTLYVPVDLHAEVIEWIENHKTLKVWVKEMTDLSRKMVRLYARTKPRKKNN